MTYAASLPTLTRERAMAGTQAGLVQTCFSAGFAVLLFVTSWLSDHIGARAAPAATFAPPSACAAEPLRLPRRKNVT